MKRVVLIAMLCCLVGVSSANLVVNGDFERGDLSDWNVWGPNAKIDYYTHQGNYALVFWAADSGVWQPIEVTGGQKYRLDATFFMWSQLNASRFALVAMEVYNDSMALIGFNEVKYTASDPLQQWLTYGFDYTMPQDASRVHIVARWHDYDASAAGGVTIDNISFTQIPEPATIALLGLGAVTLFRRK